MIKLVTQALAIPFVALGTLGSLFAQPGALRGITNPDDVRTTWATQAGKATVREASLTSGSRVFPEFVNGPTSGFIYRTGINFINMTKDPVDVLIEFFDKSGQRLTVALDDNTGSLQGHFPGVSGTIRPYASGGMRTYPANEPYSEGWARITSNPPNSIAPTATWAQVNPDRPVFEVAIPLSDRFEKNVFLPFLNTDVYTTLVGATNDTDTAETITAIARSGADGSELCRISFRVNPQESGGGLLTELLPCTAGTNGSVQIMANGQGLATLALWVTQDGTITMIAPIQH